jgi:hypothetical protein
MIDFRLPRPLGRLILTCRPLPPSASLQGIADTVEKVIRISHQRVAAF